MMIFASVVFVIVFIVWQIYGFFAHCIFEWPIRLDMRTCWSEQTDPAYKKAAEAASNFVPEMKSRPLKL